MKSKNLEDVYPLSPMQEGMLFHTLYEPESNMYSVQLSCRLGNLNAEAFERAWQRVVDRHAILRTAFIWKGVEKPLQVVGRQVSLPVEREDWRGLSRDSRDERLEAYL